MKAYSFYFLLLIGAGAFVSCESSSTPTDYSSEVDLGKFDDHKYTCDEIGWSTSYPQGWSITKKSSLEALDKQSQRAAGKEENEVKTNTAMKRLLAYGIDFNNSFQSTIESFKGKSEADYLAVRKNIRESLYDSYYDAGIRIDTAVSTVNVSGVKLDVFRLNLYNREGVAYAHQEMYTAIIKDYYFTAVIAYDKEAYKEKMLPTLTKSKFK